MIQPIVTALEAFKAKVDSAIEHFRGGVNALNEDQIYQGVELLHDLGDHYYALRKTVLKHLAPSVPDATGDSNGTSNVVIPASWTQHDDAGRTVSVIATDTGAVAESATDDSHPSAADLDALADEQRAKDETAAQ